MKFFLDTANLAQIREANALGVLDGVTTNPSLMAKEGIKGAEGCKQHYLEICEIVNGDVSAEVLATDFEGMVKEGKELDSLHPNIVVKIPCIAEGIKAIRYLYGKGIRTNCTLVFSPGQALLAAKAGATYVSGRFHPPYPAYYTVHRGGCPCGDLSVECHRGIAEASADRQRTGYLPGRFEEVHGITCRTLYLTTHIETAEPACGKYISYRMHLF